MKRLTDREPVTTGVTLVLKTLSLVIAISSSVSLCSTAWAAPDLTPNELADDRPDDDPAPLEFSGARESLTLTPAPRAPLAKTHEEDLYFHGARQALSVRLGTMADDLGSRGLREIGVQYLFPQGLNQLEAGVDLLSDGTGVMHLARRFIYSRTKFRPYTKIGIGLRIDPSERLLAPLKGANYQLRASAGTEARLAKSITLRFDLEAAFSDEVNQLGAAIGYVWPW